MINSIPMKQDIRVREYKYFDKKVRNLTPFEHARLRRLKEQDVKIYSMHTDLEIKEKDFLEYSNHDLKLVHQSKNLQTALLPYQIKGLSWMINQENSLVRGGILADEMGLGKTLQMIALILSGDPSQINLIVTPTIAIGQWIKELHKHAPGIFYINLYYGINRTLTTKFNEEEKGKFKVVLSTYGTVEREYRKGGMLFNTNFTRLIIDEAHAIKDSKSSTNTAISAINSEFRWALTGTPVQNRVGDLYALVKFLNLDPHAYYFCKKCKCKTRKWLENSPKSGFCGCGHHGTSHFSWWNRRISNMIREFGFTEINESIFSQLDKITSHIILRRTKELLCDELGLPPKRVEILWCYFSPDEKEFYQNLYSGTKKQILAYEAMGTISHNYVNIFTLLQRMRLAVNHPYLITKASFYPICGYCHNEADDPVISNCKHVFCREEVAIFMAQSNKCPVCKIKMTIDLIEDVIDDLDLNMITKIENTTENFTNETISSSMNINADFSSDKKELELPNLDNSFTVIQGKDFLNNGIATESRSYQNNPSAHFPISNWMSSSKIECLLQKLYELKSDKYTQKSIIFSQFVIFLELLRWRLERAGFHCLKIYGSMPLSQRRAAIDHFNRNPNITILLISLKAGGVALDLTEASNVFIMDLWWNPAVEEQAMDRIHRIGQYRPINIYKIVVYDSIESKILILQNKKQALQKMAIHNDKEALETLTEEDLIFLFS